MLSVIGMQFCWHAYHILLLVVRMVCAGCADHTRVHTHARDTLRAHRRKQDTARSIWLTASRFGRSPSLAMLTAVRLLLTLPGQAQGSLFTNDYPPPPAWSGPPCHASHGGYHACTNLSGPDAQVLTHDRILNNSSYRSLQGPPAATSPQTFAAPRLEPTGAYKPSSALVPLRGREASAGVRQHRAAASATRKPDPHVVSPCAPSHAGVLAVALNEQPPPPLATGTSLHEYRLPISARTPPLRDAHVTELLETTLLSCLAFGADSQGAFGAHQGLATATSQRRPAVAVQQPTDAYRLSSAPARLCACSAMLLCIYMRLDVCYGGY